ncbi:ribonuclease H family protein, partial [Clostridioides difficile]|uniref:ribonuclease H family protein n=1 Tax=Clostridioides difficile TaxID=1496 RepID=UPI001033723F
MSTDALYVLSGIKPLDLKILEVAQLNLSRRYGLFPVEQSTIRIERQASSFIHPSFSARQFVFSDTDYHCRLADRPEFTIFTDGSRSVNGVGSAFVVYQFDREIHKAVFRLPGYCSVFQAELLALDKCLEFVATNQHIGRVHVFSDSLSSLMALQDERNGTPLVTNIQQRLLHLCSAGTSVSISWVKAHVGVLGNERADELAKSCAQEGASIVRLDGPLSFVKLYMKKKTLAMWDNRWRSTPNGFGTRPFFPTPGHRLAIPELELDFVSTQFLTSHGKFRQYLERRNLRRDSRCMCGG